MNQYKFRVIYFLSYMFVVFKLTLLICLYVQSKLEIVCYSF